MPPKDLARLARPQRGPRPALRLGVEDRDPAALALGRAHEICGPSRMIFAAMAAGALERMGARGPVLWIRLAHAEGRLNPDGLRAFFDPGRLVMATPRRREDLLWIMEEALRSGACRLAVVELPAPPGLTPVRRLHLAAERGGEAGPDAPPLGLLLTPDPGGAAGIETRWRMAPAPSLPPAGADAATPRRAADSGGRAGEGAGFGARVRAPSWRLELLRARMQPPRRWRAQWRDAALRLSPEAPGQDAQARGAAPAAPRSAPAAIAAGC